MFTRGVVVEKFYPISYLTIKKTNKNKTKQNKKRKIKQKQKRPFFGRGGVPSYFPSFFLFFKKNFDSRKLIFHIPNFILKNIHNVDK